MFQGYWKRPQATEAAFFEMDGKRFFRSGDIGILNVSSDGTDPALRAALLNLGKAVIKASQ